MRMISGHQEKYIGSVRRMYPAPITRCPSPAGRVELFLDILGVICRRDFAFDPDRRLVVVGLGGVNIRQLPFWRHLTCYRSCILVNLIAWVQPSRIDFQSFSGTALAISWT